MIESVPAGPWAVGVSGGADSVALLAMLRARSDLSLHVVHLDHQLRGAESTADAEFVAQLCSTWNIPCTIGLRERMESKIDSPAGNPSEHYRELRLALFREVVSKHGLGGVILAHHADDQAETVFLRLLRGSSYVGLTGMSPRAVVGGLTILRPLLGVRRAELRDFLQKNAISWREDASNQSAEYLRNRVRQILCANHALTEALLDMSAANGALRDWARASAPALPQRFAMGALSHIPSILAAESARRWLGERGVPSDRIDPAAIERLLTMSSDAASAPRQDFPGPVPVRRRSGMIFADQG